MRRSSSTTPGTWWKSVTQRPCGQAAVVAKTQNLFVLVDAKDDSVNHCMGARGYRVGERRGTEYCAVLLRCLTISTMSEHVEAMEAMFGVAPE